MSLRGGTGEQRGVRFYLGTGSTIGKLGVKKGRKNCIIVILYVWIQEVLLCLCFHLIIYFKMLMSQCAMFLYK